MFKTTSTLLKHRHQHYILYCSEKYRTVKYKFISPWSIHKYSYFVCYAIFWKASFTLSRCTPRCLPAICSQWTGANRNESWMNSSAFIHSRQRYGTDPVWGKKWPRPVLVMLRQFITGVAPEALRCITVRPDTPRLCPGHRRQSPGVTTASPVSRKAKTGVVR